MDADKERKKTFPKVSIQFNRIEEKKYNKNVARKRVREREREN